MPAAFAAMLLADARLPTGSHAHSGGLEPALLEGMEPGRIPEYLAARLATVVRVDAGTALAARWALLHDRPLQPVQDAWAARTPGERQRDASALLGRGWLRLLRSQWPEAGETRAVAAVPDVARPVAVGAAALLLGLAPGTLVELICYEDIATVTAAALKLEPLDPLETVGWARGLAHCASALARELSGEDPVTEPHAIPATSAPQLEAWLVAHAAHPRRLFRA